MAPDEKTDTGSNATAQLDARALAQAHHDLRTPLAAVMGFAELLALEPSITADQQVMVAAIQRNAALLEDRVESLINDVRATVLANAAAHDKAVDEASRAPAARAGDESHSPTILVADDSEAHRRLLATYLQALGCVVREARNGQEAIAAVQQSRPALVFMDVVMPVVSGLEAIARIRLHYAADALPIVAMSSNYADDIRAALHLAGSNDFIPKPLDQLQIKAIVRRYT